MNKIILKNGIYGGLAVSAVMGYVTYSMKENPNMEPSMALGFGSMIVAFLFVLFGILQQKKANNDQISFGAAFKTGLLITLITSTIYVLVWLFIYYNIFPDFIEKYSEIALKNLSGAELSKAKEEMEFYKKAYESPFGVIGLTYMEILPLGIVFTLIYSVVGAFLLKKKQ
ncbi:DUF4199 domain-containing protein [Flavobacterium urocaniciphilum]|uniref:DUF4199 domain-containing protein n=1 Tax=Flavobacterium urocaniciphilum TaxID=1299341 RepID=A0A1H9CQ94_9FLAO|nr:DUF4199 domain-containing protein [Flavobacterium urocaniciphilum]SEQ03365.1 Protein of unknown function [Flavobacterium urocaniciphilum]